MSGSALLILVVLLATLLGNSAALEPVIFVPGFAGSGLDAKLERARTPSWFCFFRVELVVQSLDRCDFTLFFKCLFDCLYLRLIFLKVCSSLFRSDDCITATFFRALSITLSQSKQLYCY